MIAPQFNEVLERLDEVRAIFILGQRAVPFMEDVLGFLRDITPILDDINASAQFSTSNMPKAASQLQSVSQATELATTEILNVLDQLFVRIDEVEAEVKNATSQQGEADDADAELYQRLETLLAQDHAALWAEVQAHQARQNDARQAATEAKDTVVAFANQMRSQLSAIMMSLQVQDITAQKLASVNQLIEAVQNRMDRLASRLSGKERPSTPHQAAPPKPSAPGFLPAVFDQAADYNREKSVERQSSADEIINLFQAGDGAAATATVMQPPITPPPSQGDIDTLFNNPSGDGAAEQDDIDALFATPQAGSATPTVSNEPAGQADIDALFGGGSASEPAGQNDIDALFAGGGSEPAGQDDIDALFAGGSVQEPAGQDDIDALFATPQAGSATPTVSNEPAGQADIDALFGGGSASEPAGQNDIDALFAGGGSKPAGQDDIDALFAGGSSEPAGQDDIDALFGNGASTTASQDDIDALFG
ncbi:MAG: hypothetical protein AAGJ10_06790 [Bacteroidota bacterium]